MKDLTMVKDLVTAVYFKDCYAGATTLRLVAVLLDEPVPEKYQSYEYELRLMTLEEVKI